jgi:hypothetical protein
MICLVPVSDATGAQVRYLVSRYGLTLDSFLPGCLDYSVLVMPLPDPKDAPTVAPNGASAVVPPKPVEPTAPPASDGPSDGADKDEDDEEQDKPEVPATPQVADDFLYAVHPALGIRDEFHRVSALIEDSVLSLRARRLQVEMIRRGEGLTPGQAVADNRAFPRIPSPVEVFRED